MLKTKKALNGLGAFLKFIATSASRQLVDLISVSPKAKNSKYSLLPAYFFGKEGCVINVCLVIFSFRFNKTLSHLLSKPISS